MPFSSVRRSVWIRWLHSRAVPAEAVPSRMQVPSGEAENRVFWSSFAQSLRGKVSPSVIPILTNREKVTGVWKNGHLTLWVDSEFTRMMLNKPVILGGIAQAAQTTFGCPAQVSVVTGTPPPPTVSPKETSGEPRDALEELIAF